jgi:hypothetical protein
LHTFCIASTWLPFYILLPLYCFSLITNAASFSIMNCTHICVSRCTSQMQFIW